MISAEQKARYDSQFTQTKDRQSTLSGLKAKESWGTFGVEEKMLEQIWNLADDTKVWNHAPTP